MGLSQMTRAERLQEVTLTGFSRAVVWWGVQAAAAALLVAGCGGGEPGPAGDGTLRGPCAPQRAAGLFEVELGDMHTSVSGRVTASAPPVTAPRLEGMQGACRLLRRQNPFCDPACGSEQLCAPEGRCVPAPAGVSLGTVAVAGLKKMVAMRPLPPTNEYLEVMLPHPGYDVGAAISLTSEGGGLAPLRLRGVGVARVELTSADWTVSASRNLVVSWARGAPPARVQVRIDIDQHGMSPVTLACDVDDGGTLTLQSSLLGQLVGFGVSGFPSISVVRRTDDSVDVSAGCVGLGVFSRVRQALQVDGHTPCDASRPCPPGKTCDLVKETCL